jgi:hypothetical protein
MESPTSYPPESPMDQEDVPFPCKGCGEVCMKSSADDPSRNSIADTD